MSDFQSYEFKTNILNNQVYANPRVKIFLDVHLKNKSNRSLSGFIVEIMCPPKVLLNKKRKGFGTVLCKETNKAIYKLKFDEKGVYDLEVILKWKKEIIDRLPIKCYIGVPMPTTQDVEIPVKMTPNDSMLQGNPSNPSFCSYCGRKIETRAKFCPNCGNVLKSR